MKDLLAIMIWLLVASMLAFNFWQRLGKPTETHNAMPTVIYTPPSK